MASWDPETKYTVQAMHDAPPGWRAVFHDQGAPMTMSILYFAHLVINPQLVDSGRAIAPMVLSSLGYDADGLVPAPSLPCFVGIAAPDEDVTRWVRICEKAFAVEQRKDGKSE